MGLEWWEYYEVSHNVRILRQEIEKLKKEIEGLKSEMENLKKESGK